jgi:hypothetical protein
LPDTVLELGLIKALTTISLDAVTRAFCMAPPDPMNPTAVAVPIIGEFTLPVLILVLLKDPDTLNVPVPAVTVMVLRAEGRVVVNVPVPAVTVIVFKAEGRVVVNVPVPGVTVAVNVAGFPVAWKLVLEIEPVMVSEFVETILIVGLVILLLSVPVETMLTAFWI